MLNKIILNNTSNVTSSGLHVIFSKKLIIKILSSIISFLRSLKFCIFVTTSEVANEKAIPNVPNNNVNSSWFCKNKSNGVSPFKLHNSSAIFLILSGENFFSSLN